MRKLIASVIPLRPIIQTLLFPYGYVTINTRKNSKEDDKLQFTSLWAGRVGKPWPGEPAA